VIGTRDLPSGLVRTRPLIDEALRAAVGRLPRTLRLPVAYHLGWSAADGSPEAGDAGKAIRPALTVLAAEAVGGSIERVLPGAAAVELVHNFSLLHDDVMDGDRERRHRPTVWALFGVGQAIVAGDALLALALELLLEAGPSEAARELTTATAGMIQGQAEDLAFESRLDVTPGECLSMSAHKTALLLSCAPALGAILGGADASRIAALRTFGFELGVAFQVVDDLLGIWGDPAATGKPVASDLRQHKKSLPVVHALAMPEGDPLRAALSKGELSDEDVASAMSALGACGSREWGAALAHERLDRALQALDAAPLEPGPLEELREIAEFITRRTY